MLSKVNVLSFRKLSASKEFFLTEKKVKGKNEEKTSQASTKITERLCRMEDDDAFAVSPKAKFNISEFIYEINDNHKGIQSEPRLSLHMFWLSATLLLTLC